MKQKSIWVVEIKFDDTDWMTTVEVALSRDEAIKKAKDWKSRNSSKTRLVRYYAP